jgi:nucleotide-binding universal stress UspA family protein
VWHHERRHKERTMQKIVAATDFSLNATHAVRRAALVASSAPATLELLHVLPERASWMRALGTSEDEIALLERAEAQLRSVAQLVRATTDVTAHARIARGRRKDAIENAARGAGLLVVGGARSPMLAVAGLGHRLIRRTGLPVLIVRKPPAHRYGRVLVAVDLATAPEKAIAVARVVAPGARVDIVHAYRGAFEGRLQYAGASDAAVERHRHDARRDAVFRLSDLLSTQDAAAHVATAHVVHGHPVSEVLEKERQLGAGLVVVSRPARSLLGEIFLPSVTSALLESGTADVLVVPA